MVSRYSNLSQLPPDVIDYMKRRLSGERSENAPQSTFEIVRSLPHGNVMAVLETAKQVGMEQLLGSRPCRERDLIMALIASRILSPRSKLSTNPAISTETAKHPSTPRRSSLKGTFHAVTVSRKYRKDDQLSKDVFTALRLYSFTALQRYGITHGKRGAAEALGLSGNVNAEAFKNLLDGLFGVN